MGQVTIKQDLGNKDEHSLRTGFKIPFYLYMHSTKLRSKTGDGSGERLERKFWTVSDYDIHVLAIYKDKALAGALLLSAFKTA